MSAYLQEFKSKEDMASLFMCEIPDDLEIMLAWYGYGDYCGRAMVVYRYEGKLYEVNASHCSCYGIEGQWEPEETSVKALRMRDLTSEHDGAQEAKNAMLDLLDKMEAEGQE